MFPTMYHGVAGFSVGWAEGGVQSLLSRDTYYYLYTFYSRTEARTRRLSAITTLYVFFSLCFAV